LFNAMTPKQIDGLPFQGIPKMIYLEYVPRNIFGEDALATLSEKLSTPLQFEFYLTRALEEAHKVGQKPVQGDIIDNVLAKDFNGLEPRLTKEGWPLRERPRVGDLVLDHRRNVSYFAYRALTPLIVRTNNVCDFWELICLIFLLVFLLDWIRGIWKQKNSGARGRRLPSQSSFLLPPVRGMLQPQPT
jgi:hypothetical protein